MNTKFQNYILILLLIAPIPAMAAKILPANSPAPQAAPTTVTAAATPASTPVAPAQPVTATRPVIQQPATAAATAPFSSFIYLGGQVGNSTIGATLGYQFSRMYAMELTGDYVDPKRTVEASGATSELKIYRVGLSGVALFPVKFNEMGPMALYLKVGYGRTTETNTVNDPGLGIPGFPATTTVTTTITTGVTGGAGVQVELSKNSIARLGGNYVGNDRSVYLGAFYKF